MIVVFVRIVLAPLRALSAQVPVRATKIEKSPDPHCGAPALYHETRTEPKPGSCRLGKVLYCSGSVLMLLRTLASSASTISAT